VQVGLEDGRLRFDVVPGEETATETEAETEAEASVPS
jgi:hypothetical protein